MSNWDPQANEIFIKALNLPSLEERAAFLTQACAGKAALRAQVDSLLDAHQRAGTFLEDPATATMPDRPVAEGAGTVIGPYKLLEQIGEGGFGVVYMAEQEHPIRRKVALKIIKPGMDTRQVTARFEAERQALALMDHPNIARVFDAGETTSGRPYFVMELVKGIPITAYCDQAKLGLRERLELFQHVCQAVQHAHHKGIMHRDIKPSNILVTLHDGVPVVKVIDFGIAKAMGHELTDKTMFTGFAQVMGTPLYASPEQVALSGLDIDTRTDVYSLGVLLYELLTGTTPFEKERMQKAAYEEMRRIVREEEPPRPSVRMTIASPETTDIAAQRASQPRRLAQIFRGELDWIVMKALEKDRSRRYDTPLAFAGDIARYLANDAVEARPPSTVYRIDKFVRRHTWGSAVAAAAVLLLGLSTVLIWNEQRKTAGALARMTEAQGALVLAVKKEGEERDTAVKAEQRATFELVDNYTSRGVEDSDVVHNGLAALWFANAAVTAHDDPERVQANLLRMNNWLRGQWTPVAAVGQTGAGWDHLTFDPENARYLITFTRGETSQAPPQIWDLATEQPLHLPAGFTPLGDAVWAAGGQVLLGSTSGKVALASMPELKILHQWDAGGAVRRVAVSADRQVVAAACGQKLLAWNVSAKADPALVEHPAEIVHLAFAPKGDYLVTATDTDGQAPVFAVEASGSASPTLRLTLGPVTHIYRGYAVGSTDGFSHPPVFVDGGQEGQELVTFEGSTFKLYDAASGAELAAVGTIRGAFFCMNVSPDGHTLALGMGTSALVDVSTKKTIQTFTMSLRQAFSPNGSFYAHSNTGVQVEQLQDGKITSRAFPSLSRLGQPAFSNDGQYMAVLNAGVVQVMRIPSSSFSTGMVHRVPRDGGDTGMAFSRNGQYVVPIGGTRGKTTVRTIRVYETETGSPVGQDLPLDADLVSADFSPDGQLVAALTGRNKDQRQLRIWNWQTGALACPPFPLDSEPVSVAFAPDGKAVAVHSMNGAARLIDPATGDELWRAQCRATRMVEGSHPWCPGRGTIGFSHDGRTFYTWGSPVVQAWDRATGRERFAVRHRQDCWACAESPDGHILATTSFDGYLRFWDTANGDQVLAPIEHPNQVLTVAFSPDGRLIATACAFNHMRVWEVSTGKLVHTMPFANDNGGDIRFTPDGRFVITGTTDSIQLWDSKLGYAVSPRIPTGSSSYTNLDITQDGHWAVISGTANFSSIVDLQPLTVAAKGSPEEALLWTELLSSVRVDGSNIVNLTNAAWLERWRQYRRQHPEFRPLEDDKLP